MTFEEITQTLQTVAENQARAEALASRLDETVKQIAEGHKTLIELVGVQDGRLDGHDTQRHETDKRIEALINAQVRADEHIEALINAQVRYEAKQDKLEEAFRLVAVSHAQLVEMIQLHENRLDGHDEAQARADVRIDALIDDQIAVRRQAEERGRILDEKLARLQEAQSRADEQIRLLTGHNSDTTR